MKNTVNGNSCDGVMGYIFDLKNEDDGTQSFSIAGLRVNKGSSGWQGEAYVETYQHVAKNSIESGPGFKTASGANAQPVHKGGWTYDAPNNWGKIIVPASQLNSTLANANPKTVEIWVELVANLGDGNTGRSGIQGSYTVNFYRADPGRTVSGNTISYTNNNSSTLITSATIPASAVNNAFTTSLPQTEQGFYATVYGGQRLTGEWQFKQIKAEAEEIEE